MEEGGEREKARRGGGDKESWRREGGRREGARGSCIYIGICGQAEKSSSPRKEE